MTSLISCTHFLASIRSQLAEGSDGHYIDKIGGLQENKVSVQASHPIASSAKIADLFNSALLDAIRTRNNSARSELLYYLREGNLDSICEKNERISSVAMKALGKSYAPSMSFQEAMLKMDAAKIIKKEGITSTNAHFQSLVDESLSLSSGSSESSRSNNREMNEIATAIAKAFFAKDLSTVAALIPDYKANLAATWIAKAAEAEHQRGPVLAKLLEARARCLNTEEFDEEFGLASKIEALSSPQVFAERVATEASILSMQALIGSKEVAGIESILDERIEEFLKPIKDLDDKLEKAYATQLNMQQKLANLERKEAARLERETKFTDRSACYLHLCAQVEAKDKVTYEEFLALPGILDNNNFTTEDRYENRVRLWEASPLQRLLVGSRDGSCYEGSAADLYTQELLHSLPKASNLLANTCFASAYAVNPASRLRLSDSTVEFPGVRMLCAFEALNPWHSDSPKPAPLEKVLHGDEPENIIEKQLRAALLLKACDIGKLEADTSAERAEALARAGDGRAPNFTSLGKKQESLLLSSLMNPETKDSKLAAMKAICAEETARGLGPTISGAGHFTISANLSDRIYHRHLSTEDAADMGFLGRYSLEAAHSVTVSIGTVQQFVLNLYNPLDAAAHIGLVEVVVTDPLRGFTVKFYKEF